MLVAVHQNDALQRELTGHFAGLVSTHPIGHDEHAVDGQDVVLVAGAYLSGVGGGAASVDIDTAITLGAKIDGTRDEIYLVVAPFSANSDVAGGITWRELL